MTAPVRDTERQGTSRPPVVEGRWDARAVHERSPDPFVALAAIRDEDGAVVDFECLWANAAADALPGAPREGFAGRRLTRTFAEGSAPRRMLPTLAAAVDVREAFVRTVRYEVDGDVRWLRVVATAPAPDRLAVSLGDVTEQRLANERLAESEERLRLIVTSWAQAVWETDPDGKAVKDSPSWRAYTGQTVAELLGDGWAGAVHPDDREDALRFWLEGVRARRPVNLVFRVRHAGEWRWTNVRAAPVVGEDGGIRKWVGMNIDVTAAREAREELRRSEERLRLAMQVAGFATFDHDLRTGRTHWSPTLGSIVGEPAGTFVAGLAAYVHPDDAAAVATATAETLESDRPYRYEHRIVTADGSVRWVGVHGQTMFGRVDGARRPVRSIGVVVDLTEQRRAGDLRDAFVGMLSHELRTPVTAIYGGAQMLVRHSLPVDVRAEILADIASESDRMRRLVENLLVLAKVERRAEVGVPVPVPVLPIVARAVADERRRHPDARIEIDAAHGLPAVLGDEAAVELAVLNLISNALKYGADDGVVCVRVTDEGDAVTIRVLDEGAGLPTDGDGRLFELFYRSDDARRTASGAGIGLYVARALIEGVGGRVWAANRPDRGAEFGIALPVVADPEDGAA